MRYQVVTVLLVGTVAAACRSETTSGPTSEPVTTSEAGGAAGAKPGDGAAPGDTKGNKPETQAEATNKQPARLEGFSLTGADSCLALAANRRCLTRSDPVSDGCKAAKGEIWRCSDCRVLCSVAFRK